MPPPPHILLKPTKAAATKADVLEGLKRIKLVVDDTGYRWRGGYPTRSYLFTGIPSYLNLAGDTISGWISGCKTERMCGFGLSTRKPTTELFVEPEGIEGPAHLSYNHGDMCVSTTVPVEYATVLQKEALLAIEAAQLEVDLANKTQIRQQKIVWFCLVCAIFLPLVAILAIATRTP